MRLIYGTTNQAKLDAMRRCIELGCKNLGIELVGLSELGVALPKVDESGNSPLENARIKAQAYYGLFKQPVFSCDSGLYIEGLDDERQPAVHVRNVNGKYLNDEQMIEYYSGLAEELGGQMIAAYRNAICMIIDDNIVYEYDGDDIGSDRFILTAKPHPKRTAGFPLDSLSVRIEDGQYYIDIDEQDDLSNYSRIDRGFADFFARTLEKR